MKPKEKRDIALIVGAIIMTKLADYIWNIIAPNYDSYGAFIRVALIFIWILIVLILASILIPFTIKYTKRIK